MIPEGLGQLKALYAFSGLIPSSLGNMKELESLDQSNNNLSKEILTQLASLSFLILERNKGWGWAITKIATPS